MSEERTPGALGSNDGLGPTDEERDVVAQLRLRVLREHGGKGDGWKHHWNLTHGDSLMHREAITEIERLRALLERSKRGEHICLKCGLRQDGYDAAAHAAAYPGF